ncbi:hypothetical protein J2X02_003249 [Pseudoxanthomonas japonensis]|uniref:hypothetical protein n=1 Tax=Pseudoxanthomonas japonensis TaxID=69284 RepID=UPI00285D7369|nr:hypothetical protein [Pseudoxanthomonas japonensis]MDR7070384.1 hypothetical protein [Pseudoxanthomonas japonensis]
MLGISFIADGRPSGVLYQVLNDFDGISHVPASLFDLKDGRCSSFWVAKYDADGSLLLWPQEFFVDYFHDDLSDGDSAAVHSFRKAVDGLKKEAGVAR